jgi:xyloglucan-specific endo-beta-1,4-glucanase
LGGALPISSTGSSIGTVTVAGSTFKLYSGPNGSTTVWSFVAESAVNNMAADLINFYDYLISNGHISSSQYLQVLQGGTEAFTGSGAEFTCSLFYAAIN